MADCCAELKGELSTLRAEVAKLNRIDEEAIIKKAVERAKNEIIPLLSQIKLTVATLSSTLDIVKKTAETAKEVADAAKALADALKALLKLVPHIPAIIALLGLAAIVTGVSLRLAATEFRVGVLEGTINSVLNIIGQLTNTISRLQNELRNIKLTPGAKGDRGLPGMQGIPGKDGYTPVKGRDYFDGIPGKDGYSPVKNKDYFDGAKGKDGYTPVKDRDYRDGRDGRDGYIPVKGKDYFDGAVGKAGYTPVKGKDYIDGEKGKDGYTPVKGKDYFDGEKGKDGYIPVKNKDYFDGVPGRNGLVGKDGIRGLDGKEGKGTKGDKGEQGRPGRDEVPTDLSPVLSAIASLSNKVTILTRQVDIVHEAVNIEIDGSIGSESCASGIEPFAYSGLGLVGIHNQVIAVANTISRVHEDVCNIYNNVPDDDTEPEEIDLLQRIYQIVGGDVFFQGTNVTEPRFITNPEVKINAVANSLYNDDESEMLPHTCNNLIDLINTSNAVSYYRMGLHEYPASLPESLISKDEGFLGNLIPNENKDIRNLTRYVTWFVERFDEVVGQWEIPIEIKDSDPSKPGDQPVGIKLPNIAEAIAEMFILCFQTNLNSETMLNMQMRTMLDGASDKQQNFVNYKLLQSLTDWAGFKQKDIKLKMPLCFTLGKSKYAEILKESEVDVGCVEFDDKFGLEIDLMRFREASAILGAIYKKKINPTGDIKAQVLKYLLDTITATNKVNTDTEEDNFEQFIQDVETGFINAPGMKDATNPYGRPFTQRPKIRDLTKYVPPTT